MKTSDITDIQVCSAFAEKGEDNDALAKLVAVTGAPRKVAFRAMERADSRGLIDWGVSLRTGWLTAKGLALVAGTSLPK